MRVLRGNDGIVLAVQDKRGREITRSVREVGIYKAAGDGDYGTEPGAICHDCGAGKLRGARKSEKGSERDAGEDEALGVDTRSCRRPYWIVASTVASQCGV